MVVDGFAISQGMITNTASTPIRVSSEALYGSIVVRLAAAYF